MDKSREMLVREKKTEITPFENGGQEKEKDKVFITRRL